MKKKMIWRFIIPTVCTILLATVAAGVITAIALRGQIQRHAQDQVTAQIDQVLQSLEMTDTLMQEKVQASMKVLISHGLALGTPSMGKEVSVGAEMANDILLGETPQANKFALVDQVKALMGGTATLFVRRATDFVRITTNVSKEDGARAVGTLLDPNGKAIAAIRDGKSFYGQVDILGRPYLTGYEPMRDKNGIILGVWYVGYPVSTLTQLGEQIAKAKILENGFLALIDDRGKVRFRTEGIAEEAVGNLFKAGSAEQKVWRTIRKPFAQWGFEVVAAYPFADIQARIMQAITVVLIAGIAFTLSLTAALTLTVRKMILEPLRRVSEAAAAIARGDLAARVKAESKDEMGQLMSSMNSMTEKLGEVIVQTTEAAQRVCGAADQIAEANQNFAHRISEQAASVEETSSAMEEMAASIKHAAENSRQASGLAQESRKGAEAGSAVMHDTIAAMDEISKSSGKIASISSVIEEIAFQTNLLALNAAVEAARAGEHGMGFAVVAEEIRNLAQKTSHSAKEITALIEDSSSKTGRGVQLARELQKKLEEISGSVKKVSDLMDEIASAASEQASGINQVNQAISHFDEASQQNSSMTEETAGSTEELAKLARDLTQLIAYFSPQTQRSEPVPPLPKPSQPASAPPAKRMTPQRPAGRTSPRYAMTAPARKVLANHNDDDAFKEF